DHANELGGDDGDAALDDRFRNQESLSQIVIDAEGGDVEEGRACERCPKGVGACQSWSCVDECELAQASVGVWGVLEGFPDFANGEGDVMKEQADGEQ